MKKDITRRDFLKSAGAVAVGAMTMGLFGGCAAAAASEETAAAPTPAAANTGTSGNPSGNPSGGPGGSVFDFDKRTVLLNNGMEMPILGIGTFMLSPAQAEESVCNALASGYHLIDTASAYNNEESVGRGIAKAGVAREDLFLTTKLWPSAYDMGGIDAALERLGLDYIDLLLLHQPFGDYLGGYAAMEDAVAQGKVRAIGLSNFSQDQFQEVVDNCTILPAVHQVETHLHYQQAAMKNYLYRHGAALEGWFPLGGRGNTQVFFEDETVVDIAAAHGRTAPQIILRWHLQDGHIVIPGSSNADHIKENIDIFDFELSGDEMARLRAMDQNAPFFPGLGGTNAQIQDMFNGWAERWGLNLG